MFGFGKNNAAIDAFADGLADELVSRFPPRTEQDVKKTAKSARNFSNAAAQMVDKLAAFVTERKLGVYGKARLLNRIKWRMREVGYRSEFIDVTVLELTRATAKTAPQRTKA